ncbi:MAG TPA: hypothetical protein PK514_01325 [Spirochaetota bacterium]|nr:hypothetical protein [Spirochaetota bacterium]
MKRITIALLTAALVSSCSGSGQKKNRKSEFIDLFLEQEGRIVNIIDDTAEISRKQFRFVFNFRHPDSVLLNASFNPESFDSARSGTPLVQIPGFINNGIAEELFNAEYFMFISDDSPNYWYYSDDSDSRFDSVTKDENGYTCRRTVSSFIDLDGKAEKLEISKIKQDTIYIVIVMIEWNDDFTKMIERSRRYLKIKFIL